MSTSGNVKTLIKMANQIATFFEAEAEFEVAADDVAGHIKRSWDPRMRHRLIDYIDENGGEGLMPVAAAAFERNREALLGTSRVYGRTPSIPEEQRWVGPAGGGDAG